MHKVHLYALSTCGWCKKAKAFFEQNNIQFTCSDVDLLDGEEKARAKSEIEKVNPRRSYPTILVDDQVLVGFDECKLKEIFEL